MKTDETVANSPAKKKKEICFGKIARLQMSLATAESGPPAAKAPAARSSLWDALRGCGISGMRIDKVELRQKVLIPAYLRTAMAKAISTKDVGGAAADARAKGKADEVIDAEVENIVPLVVFVNSRSGGRRGPELMIRLQELISEEQVFDLSVTKPPDFVQYGLTCLEKLADRGDYSAKIIRNNLRVMVAGGDGTVGWVLGSLGELFVQNREPIPPTGVIPLGTGNDLSRSFGWGGSFPYLWKSAVKRSLLRATSGPVKYLDSWQVTVVAQEEEILKLPYSLKPIREYDLIQRVNIDGDLPERVAYFGGVFYNYFSIGMDAQIAYGFHHLREEKPFLAKGPIANKLIYATYGCTQGWFVTSCVKVPQLRGLNNILSFHIRKHDSTEWERILIHSSVRAVVALNLNNYGSGRNPWGHPTADYLQERNFIEAHADDGLLEIFGFKQGWHTSFVMVNLISAKHIAQAAEIKLEVRGGQWKEAYFQMDGEPWKQPISADHSMFVTIKKVPFQSRMINCK